MKTAPRKFKAVEEQWAELAKSASRTTKLLHGTIKVLKDKMSLYQDLRALTPERKKRIQAEILHFKTRRKKIKRTAQHFQDVADWWKAKAKEEAAKNGKEKSQGTRYPRQIKF